MKHWMPALLWKEWRESGVAAAISVLLTVTLAGLTKTFEPQGMPANPMEITPLLWPLFALFAAGPAFAGEARDGTLAFLAGLPVDRADLWKVKTAGVLLRWLALVALSVLLWALLCPLLLGRPPHFELFFAERIIHHRMVGTGVEEWEEVRHHLLPGVLFGVGFGAAALGGTLCFSALFESAAIAGAAGFAVVSAAAAALHQFALPSLAWLGFDVWLLGAAFLPVALWGSHAAFTAGDLRPGRAKLVAAGRALLLGSVPVLAGVLALITFRRP